MRERDKKIPQLPGSSGSINKPAVLRCARNFKRISMAEKRKREFRVNAKNVGLTFSAPVGAENPIPGKQELLDELKKVTDMEVENYIVAVETHEDGRLHYHVYLGYKSKIDIVGERKWDCFGVHPNIMSGTKKAWQHYCAKDGDFITNFYVQKVTKYASALAASTVEEGLTILAEAHPRDYLLQRDRIKKNLEDHLLAKELQTVPSDGEVLWSTLGQELLSSIPLIWKKKSVILNGSTNLGKTSLAKALGPNPYLVSHMDQLRSIPVGTSHLVFDDMAFHHFPREAVIHLLDLAETRALHVRYAVALLRKELPRVFTTNKVNFLGVDQEVPRRDDPAIMRRYHWIDIEEPLY